MKAEPRHSQSGERSKTTGQAQHEKNSSEKKAEPRRNQRSQSKSEHERTTGQAQHERNNKAEKKSEPRHSQSKKDENRTTGQAQHEQSQKKGSSEAQKNPSQQKSQSQNERQQGSTTGQGSRQQSQQGGRENMRQQGADQQHQQGGREETRVQTREGANVTINQTQRTRIQSTILSRRNAPRVNEVNFSVHVGTVVPRRVRIVAVPDVLISIHPAWRDDHYFIVRDEVVIVNDSREIVAVIPARSGTVGSNVRPHSSSVQLSSEEIRTLQIALKDKGFDIEIDGVLGPGTRHALIEFQQREGFQATGQINSRTVTALGISNKIKIQNEQNGSLSTTGQGGDKMKGSGGSMQQPSANQNGQGSKNMPSGASGGNNETQKMPSGAANENHSTTGQGGTNGHTTGQGGNQMQQPSTQGSGQSQSNGQMKPSQPQSGSGGSKSGSGSSH
jgi:peptidoglycan hydrolase-like protein with peptidoglycan-binding domain